MHDQPDDVVIVGEKVRVVGHQRIGEPASTPKVTPKLELRQEGDRITGVEITCSCGEIIRLSFQYNAPD
jgi:hypothetical protein